MKTRNLQYRFLTELGEIIHKAKSGRLILKLLEESKQKIMELKEKKRKEN